MWIRKLVRTEGIFESPIDLNIAKMKEIEMCLLEWINFEVPPKKMKVTNTGHTSKLAKIKQIKYFFIPVPLLY